MKIGIDARMNGPSVGGGGLGRYVEQLTRELPIVAPEHHIVLFSPNIPWYTLKEQLFLAPLIDRAKLDLIHFPHWNVPLRLKTPFVVTIHDLILLNEPHSARATTLHPILYAIKYRGFRHVLSHAINASKKIITISHATKSDILQFFPKINPEKIVVIYEGITPLPRLPRRLKPAATASSQPFLLYIGNCYPHKNLETLLSAMSILHQTQPEIQLILAGRDDVFQQRLINNIKKNNRDSFIHVEKNPTDARLAELYAQTTLYVFPSRIEGFGLPALEAMSLGVPVVASDIPSLREILGNAAVYFSPNAPQEMADVLAELLQNPQKREKLISRGYEQIKKYSWKKMTEQTVRVYEESLR